MTDQNNKVIINDFRNGMEDFGATLNKIQKQNSINEQDLKSLEDAKRRTVTSTQAYFNNIGVDPEILALLKPLLKDPDSFNDSKKILEFEKKFKNLVNNIRKKLHEGDESEIAKTFPAITDAKSVQATEIKLEAIMKAFSNKIKKIKH